MLGLFALAAFPPSGAAQTRGPSNQRPAPNQPKSPSADSRDIVITAIPDGPFAVTIRSDNGASTDAVVEHQASMDARLFARCIGTTDGSALHDAIDGPPNRSVRARGLDRIVRNHAGCYPGSTPNPMWKDTSYGDCHMRGDFIPVMDPKRGVVGAIPIHVICQAFYDRGALVEKALELYTPDLAFATTQLMQPGVVARFRAREDSFDKSRSKQEQTYAAVAGCLVAVHPELALQYPKSAAGSAAETKIRNVLIGTTPQCVGGAKTVSLDPAEFRVFLADAIYSWATALRGTESLVPMPPQDAKH